MCIEVHGVSFLFFLVLVFVAQIKYHDNGDIDVLPYLKTPFDNYVFLSFGATKLTSICSPTERYLTSYAFHVLMRYDLMTLFITCIW